MITENGKKYVVTSSEKIELTKDTLSLHRILINLPWNNIYTTNYDELLEMSIDSDSENELKRLKDTLFMEQSELYDELQKKETEQGILKDEQIKYDKDEQLFFSDAQLTINNSDDEALKKIEQKINKNHYCPVKNRAKPLIKDLAQ